MIYLAIYAFMLVSVWLLILLTFDEVSRYAPETTSTKVIASFIVASIWPIFFMVFILAWLVKKAHS